ncbi:MAG: glutathione S-transferase family protein [Pseudomonadales bacterium]|nr:glutathione S-transferase family protein [Pseudomonadales bacterium]
MSTTQPNQLTLISHKLCPYVQRAVSVLEENGLAYKRIDIDLANKPDWFKTLSPLGKVPILVVDDETVIFESAVISEYINDAYQTHMLDEQPLEKARQRAWIEYASAMLNNIGQLYNAEDEKNFLLAERALKDRFSRLELNLKATDYFSGATFSLIDTAFAPIFRYIDVFEKLLDRPFLPHQPRLQHWRQNLLRRPSVKKAVDPAYPMLLTEFLAAKNSYLGKIAQQSINPRKSA